MNKTPKQLTATFCMILTGLGATRGAYASNGLYTDGQGLKAVTMGGVSIALPQDSMAAAGNPAGIAYVGNRFDADVQLFIGSNKAQYGDPNNRLTGHMTVPIPEFGVNYDVNSKVSIGLTSVGSGVGWKYDQPLIQGQGLPPFKALLKQEGIAPTIAFKPNDQFAIGLSLTAAYQTLLVRGAALPTPAGPFVLPYHGTRSAWTYGARVGAIWKPNDTLTFGLSYTSKQKAGSFSGYDKDLLAVSDGKLDSPEILGAGAAFRVTSRFTIAADYRLIRWSQVKGVASDATFGWHDQRNYRVGAAYELGDTWTLRGGANYANRQIHSDALVSNLLVPGLLSRSISAGVTHTVGTSSEVTFGVVRDISLKLKGTGNSTGSSINLRYGYAVLGFGHKF